MSEMKGHVPETGVRHWNKHPRQAGHLVHSAWWTAKEKKCKDSCLIQQGMKAFYNSHWLFKNVLFWINYGLTRSFKKMYREVPCSLVQFSPILGSDIRWYIITTRKLALAEYNEVDNRPYLDLISLTCTIFFSFFFFGRRLESKGWHLQVENIQVPKS